MVLANLKAAEFSGPVHLIGRNQTEVDGRPCLASIDALPEGVDLAVLAIPADAVHDAVAGCIRRKVKSAIVFASGFAEVGDNERSHQLEIAQMAKAGRLALVGPNCFGYTNYVDGLRIGFTRSSHVDHLKIAARSGVAVVAQSGGIGGHVGGALEARGVPLSYVVTTGNEAGIGLAEVIEYLAHDRSTGIILAYGEQIRQPREFLAAIEVARAEEKQVVLLHPGRSDRARSAARSHTGALAGEYVTMRVALERAGVAVVETLEELIDVGHLLLRYPKPPVHGAGVLTFSGALCAIAHDYSEALGLDLPTMSEPQKEALRPAMATFNPPDNPLDLGTIPVRQPDLVRLGTECLIKDPKTGSLIVSITGHNSALGAMWIDKLVAGVGSSEKPVILVLHNESAALASEVASAVSKHRLVLMRSPERALRAMAQLTKFGKRLVIGRAAPAALSNALPSMRDGMQPEWIGKEVLRAIGIPIPPGAVAHSPREAEEIARRIGYPVAMKAHASQLAHKTDVGGVLLNLANQSAVTSGWSTLHANIARMRPGLTLEGVLVEKMSAPGIELVLGAKRDPQWGPMLLVGFGGIFIEAINDVRFLPPDLPEEAIIAELQQLKAAKLLGQFRSRKAVDLAAVAQAASALGRLMLTEQHIQEIEINPLVGHTDGNGLTALDALVVWRADPHGGDHG